MTIERFREVLDAKHFRPFTIHLADGREIPVLDRDLITVAPSGRTVVVLQLDDTFSLIDLSSVTDLKSEAKKQGNSEMTIEKFRELLHVQPFQPFTIHLADGREVPVLHREFIMPTPSGRTVVVCQPDDTLNIIDLLLVTDLEVKPPNGSASKRRKR